MIDVALLSVIRRWHYREGVPIRAIARRTGLSRNTVRKYLASEVVEPHYSRRKTPSKLDGYEDTLTSWLFREANRSRKERRTVKQLYAALVPLGYTGSYDRVAAFARQWREQSRGLGQSAFIPLTFPPGDAFQFDWSEDWAVIDGTRTKLQVAHVKLCHSLAFFVKAYRQQTHEMLFDAHEQGFRVLGGVPERGIYDNMKTAVDKIGRGKERQINRRFQAMASHYLFEPEFCSVAAGWEKGQVEKQVRDLRHRLWQDAPAFLSLAALNQWLEKRCIELWEQLPHPDDAQTTIAQCWQAEQSRLMPMPPAFDGFVDYTKQVSSTCLITFERNRYSVPAQFANQRVSLRVYACQLVIVADSDIVAKHERVFLIHDNRAPAKTVYDWRHYLNVLQRKPGALRNGAPFKALPNSFTQLQQQLLKRSGGDREMADILALVLLYDEGLVEQAIEDALQLQHPSKQHVLNCLHRLSEPDSPPPLVPSPHLRLVIEPLADSQRYDDLREVHHVN